MEIHLPITEEQLVELEKEEHSSTVEILAIMLLMLLELEGDVEKELRAFYQKYGKDGVVTWQDARKWVSNQDHRHRLTLLMFFISERFNSLFDKLEPEFELIIRDVISKESEFFDVEIDIEEFLYLAWGVETATWLSRLHANVDLWEHYILTDLKQSILKGENIDDVLARLRGRTDSMKRVLTRLGLTESTATGSAVRKAIFKELGVSKYRFYTQADERTCEICGSMHGLTFPMSSYEVGVTASPLHPKCRCFEIPILDED